MLNPWESLCQELAGGPSRSIPSPSCFNSVKILGLNPVKSGFIPDEKLLACKKCGVIFLHDKAESHYDAFHGCPLKSTTQIDLLPYHAITMCQKLYEEAQLEEKLSLKRLKTSSLQKSKSHKLLSNSNHLDSSAAENTFHRHQKRIPLKAGTVSCLPSASTCMQRNKFSSSSSCDRLSSCEANSASSPGTESSSSAPAKLVEVPPNRPPSIYPPKGLLEILREESASLSSGSRRICGNSANTDAKNRSGNLSVSSIGNLHLKSLTPNPPSLCDSKEATYVPLTVHSSRKQISVKNMQPVGAEISRIHSTKPSASLNLHACQRSKFESFMSQSTFQQQKATAGLKREVETIDLISDHEKDSKIEAFHGFNASDESATAVFHLEQDNRTHSYRSQQIRPNYCHTNGSKVEPFDYVVAPQTNKQWDTLGVVETHNNWYQHSNTHAKSQNDYRSFGDVAQRQCQKRDTHIFGPEVGTLNYSSRNKPETSKNMPYDLLRPLNDAASGRLHKQISQNDVGVNPLTQCGCVEKTGDRRCMNSILCTVHTMEEKRRIHRPRDFKDLIREAKQLHQQNNLMRIRETPTSAKLRRVSSPFRASPHTAIPVPLMVSVATASWTHTSQGDTHLPTAITPSVASVARRNPSGSIVATALDGHAPSACQQPTILHRRVHHPSSLLRRNQQIMRLSSVGSQGKPSSAFIPTNESTPGYYTSPPPVASSATVTKASGKIVFSREFQNRVVVNDDREKSITGRSRKPSRSGVRQPPSSMHGAYVPRAVSSSTNRTDNTTAVYLRAPTSSRIPTNVRECTVASDIASSVVAPKLVGYRRGCASDLRSTLPTSPPASAATNAQHSNHPPSCTTPAIADPHVLGSNRYIVIGAKKPGSSNCLTVVPGINLLQTHHLPGGSLSTAQSPSTGFPVTRQPMDYHLGLEAETVAVGASAINSASPLDNEAAQPGVHLQLPQHLQFSRAVTGTTATTSAAAAFVGGGGGRPTHSRSSPFSASPGQMFFFQTRRL